ncbi:hypothetical protein WJX84_006657 [Apatococcus fuscideae]|uniref:EF-hand domain-containing protein n=1 Tax=Apatococcus fuscideae TaxID=2026836 RepID=A0AAW1SZV9_9CHLO
MVPLFTQLKGPTTSRVAALESWSPARAVFRSRSTSASQAEHVSATSSESQPEPTKKLVQTQIERRMPDKRLLDMAENEIAGYCLTLPGSEEAERCWMAHEYYGETKRSAESGCEIEYVDGNISGEECAQLDRLGNFARTMMSSGKIGNFVRTLYTLRNVAQKQAAKEAEAAGREAPEEPPLMSNSEAQDFENRKEELHQLFMQLDRDGNGSLDIGEFRDAMKDLGDELSGQDCGHLLEAMDIHGHITEEDFFAIVEAKGMWEKDTPITKVLRRMSLKPTWFTY